MKILKFLFILLAMAAITGVASAIPSMSLPDNNYVYYSVDANVNVLVRGLAPDKNYDFILTIMLPTDSNVALTVSRIVDANVGNKDFNVIRSDTNLLIIVGDGNIGGRAINMDHNGTDANVFLRIPSTARKGMNIIAIRDNNNLNPNAIQATLQIFVTPFLMIIPDRNSERDKNFDINFNRGASTGDFNRFISTPNGLQYTPFGALDKNFHVRGYGFYKDQNIALRIGSLDLNLIIDGNGTVYSGYGNQATPTAALSRDGNRVRIDRLTDINAGAIGRGIGNIATGIDSNRFIYMFDVNVVVPTTLTPFSNPYLLYARVTDVNNRIRSDVDDINVNLFGGTTSFYAMPSQTLAADMNVTVLICDGNHSCYRKEAGDVNAFRYPIDVVMKNNKVQQSEIQAMKGMVVEFLNDAKTTALARIAMNTDVNLMKTPQANYNNNMTRNQSKNLFGIDSAQMPEFSIDANITIFNVRSLSGKMPVIARDGVKCASNVCSDYNWFVDPNTKDGNITFKVTGFSNYGTTALDVNFNTPTVTTYASGKKGLLLDFNWAADWNAVHLATSPLQSFLHAKLYWSDTNGAMTNLIAQDFNILSVDSNAFAFTCILNPLNSDTNAKYNNSSNCTFNWVPSTADFNLALVPDGNHWIDLDINQPDRNALVVSRNVYIDNNAPTVSISAPTAGYSYAAGTQNVTVTYSGSDTGGSGIKLYQAKVDSGSWVDNSTSTSYNVTIETVGAHTIYIRAIDRADNNATTSVAFTLTAATSGNNTGASPGGGSPGGGTTGPPAETPEGKKNIIHKTSEGKPSAEDIRNLLTSAGASENAIQKASEAVGKTTVTKEVNVDETTSASGVKTYTTTITFTVSNPNKTKILKKVKVLVEVPKTVALSASELQFPAGVKYRIVKDDPIIEFEIAEIPAGGVATVNYSTAKNISQATADSIPQAVVAEFAEAAADLCPTMNCDDSNPCTQDTCSSNTCSNAAIADNSSCGTGKVCKAGSCIAKEVIVPPVNNPAPAPSPTTDAKQKENNNLVLVAVIVIIVVIAAVFVIKGKKSKGKK
ncbi:MAG: hypothetical protein Q7R70_04005 [Candidatus Diapherotrites archaeon]|nr:hypothetical protein [Candidatus Diapherotrites archaeon]